MAKRKSRKSRKSSHRAKPACKSRVARKCKKPRFTAACRAVLKNCMSKSLKESGSLKVAGKTCMPKLHSCMKHDGYSAVRKYKALKAGN
jgi:hypothetical protein